MIHCRHKFLFSARKLLFTEKVVSTGENPRARPNLLFVHGILGGGGQYRHMAEDPLTRRNYNSYLLDLPNHGKSFGDPAATLPSMGEDIAHWIQQQKFQQDLTIVGHSMGGRAVLAMTVSHPQLQSVTKRIILLDAVTHSYVGYPLAKRAEEELKVLQNVDLSVSVEKILQQIKKMTRNQAHYHLLLNSLDLSHKRWLFDLDSISQNFQQIISYHYEKAEWQNQIIAFKALKSAFVNDFSKEELKRIYPNVHIVDVDCYHNIQMEKPEVVLDAINRK